MKRFLQLFPAAILLFVLLGNASSSFALSEDGNNPQIALSVVQASPGATIEVSGGRFQPDIFVTIVIAQNGTQTELGKIIADDHGEFTTTILLPMNLQIGPAEFRGIDEKNRVAVAPLTVIADESGQDQNGQRSEEDPLLAPMPSVLNSVSTAVPPTPVSSKNQSVGSSFNFLPWMAAGIGIVALFLLALRFKR